MTEPTELAERLASFLSDAAGEGVEVTDLVRLSGGASRETWAFKAGFSSGPRRLILRRDPPGGVARSATGRATEYELLRRVRESGVPVPRVLWLSEDPATLGAPAMIAEHIEGETIARRILRDEIYEAARGRMAAQCGEILARIHATSFEGLDGFSPPKDNPGLATIQTYRSLLDSFGEPHPAFEIGLRRLEMSPPDVARLALVHGDFRNGNFIVGPEGIRAVLDWELAHAGDPWEDLGWLCVRAWRFGEPGEVGGFGSRDELFEAYARTSEIEVDREAVGWWEAMGTIKWGVICIVQAFTHLSGQVRSVELAAIGRRAVENEYDLLRLMAGS